MTLNLFIAARWGLWLSSDFRVSELRNVGGKLIPRPLDRWSPKYMLVETGYGARLAWTYTGVGEIVAPQPNLFELAPGSSSGPPQIYAPGTRRRVSVSEWLSWMFVDDKPTTVDEMAERIRSEASRIPEFRRFHHSFTGILMGPKPVQDAWVLQVRNTDVREGDSDGAWTRRRPLKAFSFHAKRVDDPPIQGGVETAAERSKLRLSSARD
ncbi:hypothetical protein [Solirubrobacter pauli]|uniref:hypothetical protein n=1 Tax=Solirubrobacter pauli TaxID=166793 RepID=UPI0011C45BBD|nr:hypothetical protein [Solirubrobacter pauli]